MHVRYACFGVCNEENKCTLLWLVCFGVVNIRKEVCMRTWVVCSSVANVEKGYPVFACFGVVNLRKFNIPLHKGECEM